MDAWEARATETAEETIRRLVTIPKGKDDQGPASSLKAQNFRKTGQEQLGGSDRYSAVQRKPEKLGGTLVALQPCQGTVRLSLVPPLAADRIRKFEESLASIPGMRVVSTGGSAKIGPLIVISVEKPLPLLRALSDLRIIARFTDTGTSRELTVEVARV